MIENGKAIGVKTAFGTIFKAKGNNSDKWNFP